MVLRKSGLLNSPLGRTRRLLPQTIAALAIAQGIAMAQHHRDFIRQDDEGHLILRFAGSSVRELDAAQEEEVVNAFVSVMVHDRLRADVLFDEERTEPGRTATTEMRIRQNLGNIGRDLWIDAVECRAVTCRVVILHDDVWSLTEHQALMSAAQGALESVTASLPDEFESDFLLAGYYQERETQYIKAYLRRSNAGSE